jgi:hypothetical protein
MSAFSLRRRLAVAAATAGLLGVALPVAWATAASADPRPGTITSVTVRPTGGWDYTGIYLSRGTVVLSGSGTVFVNGNFYGPAGTSSCTGSLAPSLPCNGLIGEIGSGPVFSIPNTDYLRVFHSGELYLAVNTPTTVTSSFGAFHVGVVGLP